MNSILRISDAASLALHTLCLLSKSGEQHQHSAHEIAKILNVSEAHLAKVLQRLAKAELVTSTRGPKGGFVMNKKPSEVSLLEIYETIDGPIGEAGCLLGKRACNGDCFLGDLLCTITNEVKEHLSRKTLADLPTCFGGSHG